MNTSGVRDKPKLLLTGLALVTSLKMSSSVRCTISSFVTVLSAMLASEREAISAEVTTPIQ